MTARTATLSLILLIAAARPAAAAGAGAEREARRNFQAGEAHFKAGLYAEALADYQAGYAAAPLPGFLINVAQCQRRLGELARARASYQKFLMVAPDSPLGPEVKRLMAELDQMLADEAAAQTQPANAQPATASTERAEEAAPALRLSPPASPEPAAATVAATLTVAATPTPPPARPLWKRWWVWGLVGAAVAGGTVAAFALSSPGTTTIHDGTVGTLRR
jgi:tetratricopeptide (TPR) repeat protein